MNAVCTECGWVVPQGNRGRGAYCDHSWSRMCGACADADHESCPGGYFPQPPYEHEDSWPCVCVCHAIPTDEEVALALSNLIALEASLNGQNEG